MNDQQSSATQLKKLEKYIYNLKAARNLNTLSRVKRDLMMDLRDHVSAARVEVDRYFTEDDTKEKAKALSRSVELLKDVRQEILNASGYDLVDVVDVAHLSALTEVIIEQLQ